MRLKRFFSMLILLAVAFSFQKSEENIRRFNQPELFEKHDIENKKVISEITELLQNENSFIASQPVQFLEQLEKPDKKTQRKLVKYKKKCNLN